MIAPPPAPIAVADRARCCVGSCRGERVYGWDVIFLAGGATVQAFEVVSSAIRIPNLNTTEK
jgi:hypothetical protein